MITGTARAQTHLQFFVGSFGQFTGQRVQALLDGAVHGQHMGQLTQRRVQLTHTHREEKRRGLNQWGKNKVSKVRWL